MKTAKTPKQRGIPATQNPKGKDVKWVEKTAILHETGMMISDKWATWNRSSKETAKKGRRRFGSVGRPQRASWRSFENEGRG